MNYKLFKYEFIIYYIYFYKFVYKCKKVFLLLKEENVLLSEVVYRFFVSEEIYDFCNI